MDLQATIAQKTQAIQAQNAAADKQKAARFEDRVRQLMPMFEELQHGLKGSHLTVVLHTNPSHLPCPAIHIKGMHPFTPAYDRLSEIFLLEKDPEVRWKAGSCNMHNYSLKDDAALTDFVAQWVAYDIAQRTPR